MIVIIKLEDVGVFMSRKRKNMNRLKKPIIPIILLIVVLLVSYYKDEIQNAIIDIMPVSEARSYEIGKIPDYDGQPYVYINQNEPVFDAIYFTSTSFETYSNLDILNRCGVAFANIGIDLMPTEERGSIGMIKPSGWHTVKYDIVDGKYLYNRCHLIGYQLTGENANEKNLITCTRYMNTVGMLEFENQVANYIKKTGNHVLYRVTPIFKENNLLASGVQMEARSVEDDGKGVSFNVFVYNVQDGITIDYATGDSKLSD